ncbi:MAG: type I DNA topoisomerase [Bacillales bacterium]|nr:type I DNA topoisomerase [Bacillales bacterium]
MKLVIVESPTKCKTIKKYLGSEYNVMASLGHIRDLSTSGKGGLGVNVLDDFKPTYINSKDKYKVIRDLVDATKKSDEVFLATDPDREGEAISWHLAEVLHLPIKTTKRLEFHEITKPAIKKALENPRTIDMSLVESQETRRIIDRIMGFELSTLLKRKIGSSSGGRVQSVTLKLITEREKEIKAFVPEEYWLIQGNLEKNINVKLESYKDQPIGTINNEEEADKILNSLPNTFVVSDIAIRTRRTESKPPFTTSTLQQEAFNRHKYSTKKTSSIAQKLYEGIDIGQDTIGLITYMRTDSIRLSPEFVKSANDYILNNYGEQYLGKINTRQGKGLVQDAHEAIRPTSLELTPKSIKQYLTNEQYNLYKLIYYRALASLMSPKLDEVTNVRFDANDYSFIASGVSNIFDGYSKLYESAFDDNKKDMLLPSLNKGDELKVVEIDKEQKFTTGPQRYTEARIVKTMEELGIGRPSTYASTISTLYDRKYIIQEKGQIYATEQGIETVDKLCEFFTPFMDTTYTAKMEQNLDSIVEGNDSRLGLLKSFYNEFEPLYEKALVDMEKVEPKQTGELCPRCGNPLVVKKSKYGEFIGCLNYPKCNYIKPKESKPLEILENQLCPKCGSTLVKRKSKKGEFYACSAYPTCKYILGNDEQEDNKEVVSDRTCPKCGKTLLIKKGRNNKGDFYACSGYPKCKFTETIK